MERIPVIDLSAARLGELADRQRIAREMDRVCQEIGFFTITGHGVPRETVDALRYKAHAFFGLPLATKRLAAPADPTTPRGYRALGIEALSYGNAAAAPADLKEYYHFGCETWPDTPYYTSEEGRRYFISNLWPAQPSGFREAAAAYYAAMERVVALMMRLTALGLGVEETFFDDKIDRHITAMRLNYYPAQQQPPLPGQLRAGAHTDYGAFTILNGENVPGGLQVRTRAGDWIDVETEPDSFVINIGDLLMRWTNDRWLSNMHRVVNPPEAAAATSQRLSIAFFQHPNYDARIECIAPPGAARHAPVLSGEYRDLKYRQTRLTAAE